MRPETGTIVRRANYGVDLLDELTGDALVGASQISAEILSSTTNGNATSPTPFRANASRWVFEGLDGDVRISIAADLYVGATIETGMGEIPAVPAATDAGVLVPVALKPRTGYPFPPSLLRVVGRAAVDAAVDPAMPPIEGARVEVVPKYGDTPGDAFSTRTTDDGQFVAWFLAAPNFSPSIPDACDIAVTVDATTKTAEDVPLLPAQVNYAPAMFTFP